MKPGPRLIPLIYSVQVEQSEDIPQTCVVEPMVTEAVLEQVMVASEEPLSVPYATNSARSTVPLISPPSVSGVPLK